MNDKELVYHLRTNPDKGFRLLMDKYAQPLYWHIRRLVVTYDDTNDVVQETFVRIFRNISQFKDNNNFSAWIYRIATNEALRFLGKKKNDTMAIQQSFDMMADEYVDYSDLESIKLQKAIHSLPPKQQATFNMRYYDEMSFVDIAQAIDSTPSSAKVNYKIAKDKITKYIKEHE